MTTPHSLICVWIQAHPTSTLSAYPSSALSALDAMQEMPFEDPKFGLAGFLPYYEIELQLRMVTRVRPSLHPAHPADNCRFTSSPQENRWSHF